MRSRWLVAGSVVLIGLASARAQPQQLPTIPVPPTTPASPTPSLPPASAIPPPVSGSQLPPLLPVPAQKPPLAEVPRPSVPGFEYDHGYLYLPDSVQERLPPEACRPLGRWWVNVSLELSWAPTRKAPATLRLPVPGNPAALTVPGHPAGLRLPVASESSGTFGAGLGLTVGRWFGEEHLHGVEGNFFFRVADRTLDGFSPGTLVLFGDGPGRSGPRLIVVPDSSVTSVFPVTLSTFFTSVDVNYRSNLYCAPRTRIDALVGYRFAYLSDEIYLGDVADGPDDRNRVLASNPFHGGQVGLAGEIRASGWYVGGSAKVALGVVTPDVCASGLFTNAEARRAGTFRRLPALRASEENEFAVFPALNVTAGRQLTDHARLFAGYSFFYLSRAARLGDVLDPSNSGLVLTDFWVQSVNLGFELRY